MVGRRSAFPFGAKTAYFHGLVILVLRKVILLKHKAYLFLFDVWNLWWSEQKFTTNNTPNWLFTSICHRQEKKVKNTSTNPSRKGISLNPSLYKNSFSKLCWWKPGGSTKIAPYFEGIFNTKRNMFLALKNTRDPKTGDVTFTPQKASPMILRGVENP